ncbi:hypothetical protein H7Y40_01330 [Pedobacter sp.]|nr:hypothetical protein [Candidatus Saccharibacteria bacterium]
MSNPERRPIPERLSGYEKPSFVGDFARSAPVEKVTDDRVYVSHEDIAAAEAFLRGEAVPSRATPGEQVPLVFQRSVVTSYEIDPRSLPAFGVQSVQELFADGGRGLLDHFGGQPQDTTSLYDEPESRPYQPTGGVIHLGAVAETSYIPRDEKLSLTVGPAKEVTSPPLSKAGEAPDEIPAKSGVKTERAKIKMLASRPARRAYAVVGILALGATIGPRAASALWEAGQSAGQDRADFSVERIVEVKDAFMDGK